MRNIFIVLLTCMFAFGCGNSEHEADYNYKNAIEYYNQIDKKPEKKNDALYFFNLASENKKYQTIDVGKSIYKLAAQILVENNKITLDDNLRLTKNIIDGVELLINESEKDKTRKDVLEEADNITNSDNIIYVTIRKILEEKSKDDFSKIKSLIINK